MAKTETMSTRSPRGTKPVSQAFFSALENIPAASRAAVAKAAQAMIRDELKTQRDATKAAAVKQKTAQSLATKKSTAAKKPTEAKKPVEAKPAAKAKPTAATKAKAPAAKASKAAKAAPKKSAAKAAPEKPVETPAAA